MKTKHYFWGIVAILMLIPACAEPLGWWNLAALSVFGIITLNAQKAKT